MQYLIPQIIEETAKRFPTKEAFRFRDESLTYAQLETRMNALANTLIDQGVQRGDRVGIYMHKALECAVAIYGIMQAGAAYVPLDPSAPPERTAFILRDCNISHIATGQSMIGKLKQLAAQESPLSCTVGLDDGSDLPWKSLSWTDVNSASGIAPATPEAQLRGRRIKQPSAHMEQDLAYIIYTSGSTGEPKGIMHTHHSGLSYARMAATLYGLTDEDRLSNFPPLHFDQSTFDYFSGALVGATTIIIPDEVRMLPASLSQLIADEQISIWYSVPFALIQLLLRGALEEHDLSCLRWIIYGGEPFPRKHLMALQALWPQAIFSNNFGPAETNQVSYYHIPKLSGDSDEPIPIGQICANMDALIVDGEDKPVARGEVGELLMRTPTMMHGYWNRPDLNARVFTAHTTDGGQQLRYYRTGDHVRIGDDGNYEFLGRMDRQIKTRGYRVELDEIEAALLSHESVEEAAAYPLPDEDIGNLIKGAVILKPGADLKVSTLMKHLMTRIPPYAVPAQIDLVDDFPRTTSGKIDRRALQKEAMEKVADVNI